MKDEEMSGLFALGQEWGFELGVEVVAAHTIGHPEIGAVLDSQCGAQSVGCAFDTPDRSRENAPAWLDSILQIAESRWSCGQSYVIRAVLASDGWWWKV